MVVLFFLLGDFSMIFRILTYLIVAIAAIIESKLMETQYCYLSIVNHTSNISVSQHYKLIKVHKKNT